RAARARRGDLSAHVRARSVRGARLFQLTQDDERVEMRRCTGELFPVAAEGEGRECTGRVLRAHSRQRFGLAVTSEPKRESLERWVVPYQQHRLDRLRYPLEPIQQPIGV